MATIGDCLERARAAHRSLARRGEAIEEEWTYVADLEATWAGRLAEVVTARGPDPTDEATTMAVDAACAEADRITDPHRALDWLSTLPQVVLVALGEAT